MSNVEKILSIEQLSVEIQKLKQEGKKIVHCHGCFDLLHIGHIRHFRQAKLFGDVLIVTLTPDRFVDKGPDRPAFVESLRAEAIASIDIVDFVSINEWPTAEKTILIIKPDFFVKGDEFKQDGSDYTGKMDGEKIAIESVGGKLAFTEDIVFSSTNLINKFLKNTAGDTKEYFKIFKNRFQIEEIFQVIERLNDIKVLVIGDAIIDDYHYCEAIGKSNKDPVLALRYKSNDMFAGGSLAIANHLSSFANRVKLISVLGESKEYEEFIRKQLNEKVNCEFFYNPDSPTLVKRRFVDGYSFNKLLEIYIMNGDGLPEEIDKQFVSRVNDLLKEYDMVIAADFGHGAISRRMSDLLCRSERYIAVNTQANAGNRGFNTISKYKRADFISLAEHEIRLETRDNNGPLRPMMDKIAEDLNCRSLIVTRGRRGCLIRGLSGDFVSVPSLASQVVDRIGAGDALFAVSAMTAYMGNEHELVGFLGNVAGALAVETIGNKKPIDKLSAKKYITSILK